MIALWKILRVSLRNQFLMKPKGRRASLAITEFLHERGFEFRSVQIRMGLAEPGGLGCLVFFRLDTELARFEAAGCLPVITALFREALAKTGYPAGAVSQVEVSAHSEETINRMGWYSYFK